MRRAWSLSSLPGAGADRVSGRYPWLVGLYARPRRRREAELHLDLLERGIQAMRLAGLGVFGKADHGGGCVGQADDVIGGVVAFDWVADAVAGNELFAGAPADVVHAIAFEL